ncbi:MAG TPA: hypothetical protein VHV55_12325 [Pirellulales bacterium]|jgi:hypothetical protein|nr:hypothetical protein [Pirellulales bacterium]
MRCWLVGVAFAFAASGAAARAEQPPALADVFAALRAKGAKLFMANDGQLSASSGRQWQLRDPVGSVLCVEIDGQKFTDADVVGLRDAAWLKGFYARRTSLTDVGLRSLPLGLTDLDLTACLQVTDGGMETVGKLKDLRFLDLAAVPITDAGIDSLSGLTQLTRISVSETKITDDSVRVLRKFKALGHLDVAFTEFDVHGADELQRTLHNVEIYPLRNRFGEVPKWQGGDIRHDKIRWQQLRRQLNPPPPQPRKPPA